MTPNVYVENGYKDRRDYLQSLADEFNTDFETVTALADLLGPSEDFDGLLIALGD